ncbi:MAG: T9SS type B sorting domain-containing protein, partial [Bacteroidia bacterium]|nr:T9SS type B sorting domain-containing protein [Bacteroidia bacterium]
YATDMADGYRWYQYDDQGELFLISEESEAEISEVGLYRYEAYLTSDQAGFTVECPSFKDFTVVSSERANINGVNLTDSPVSFDLEVIVSGIGNYEFSIGSELGPFQESNVFNDIPENTSMVYVRDRNGCGIATFDISSLIIKKGFPKFFTPNNDGINDSWQYIANQEDGFQLEIIYIFNRYGKLIISLDPNSAGWTGEVDGYRLPTSDFWYRAVTTEGRSFFGHFTLRR